MRGTDVKIIKKTDELMKYLPFLEEKNRPDVVFFQTLQIIKRKIKDEKSPVLVERNSPVESSLKRFQEASQKKIEENVLKNKIYEIKNNVEKLKKNGVNVIFIEPPNHISLFGSIREKQVRELFLAEFPQDEYTWFIVDWSKYNTNDGIHLGSVSAKKYANELIECSFKFL